MWLYRMINFQNEVDVQLIELNGCKRMRAEYIQFTISTHYSTKKQMRFHRHPVNGTWIYVRGKLAKKVSIITRIQAVLSITLGGEKR